MSTDAQTTLFAGFDPEPPAEQVRISADRRRTERQKQAIRAGLHPLGVTLRAYMPLHPDAPADPFDPASPGVRCGGCHFRVLANHRNGTWPKCTAGVPDSAVGPSGGIPLDEAPRVSHGAGTDVRAWWSACRDYEPDVSADQFRCRPSDDARPLP